MLKKNIIKLISSILLGGVFILGALPACGGSADEVKPVPAIPETTAPATETPVSPPEADKTNGDLLAQGKEIFDKTAGTVGCASCHGLEGKGGGAGPDIRGIGSIQVRAAVKGGVPAMSFIKLSDEELTAVDAYIQYLSK